MDVVKYRKWYLSENWAENRFRMIVCNALTLKIRQSGLYCVRRRRSRRHHPLVSSGVAFWVNRYELCIGYRLDSNPNVYRPIFCARRQSILARVHQEMPTFWRKIKERYYLCLSKIKILPLECIVHIVEFI
jgi:hypothetical protein